MDQHEAYCNLHVEDLTAYQVGLPRDPRCAHCLACVVWVVRV